ncbi:MAG: hypothetical protein GF341_01625 [candidate division Zixibacteria bacterium]|nr:hypothetical protein [candidate division Zixibacteria bacterium]
MLYDAILPILATTFFLIGVGALLLLFLNIIRSLRSDSRAKRPGSMPGWRVDLRRGIAIVVAIGMIGLANVTFWINGQMRLYTPVMPGLPLGTITVIKKSGSLPRVVYASIDREGREALEVFPARDTKFRLVGERIRWAPALSYFGLGDHFKLSRIDFYPQDGPDTARSTFGIEVRQGSTSLYQRILQFEGWLPIVSADSITTPVWDASSEYSRHIYLNSDQIVSR